MLCFRFSVDEIPETQRKVLEREGIICFDLRVLLKGKT